MRLIIMLGGFNPMVWLFVTPHTYFILYLEAITSGIMWAGAGLVATNFVLSIAPDDGRQLYSGLSGAFAGLAMMTTMLVSGFFLPQHLEFAGIHLEPEQVLFGLSGIARWSTQIPLSFVRDRKSGPVGDAVAVAGIPQGEKIRLLRRVGAGVSAGQLGCHQLVLLRAV